MPWKTSTGVTRNKAGEPISHHLRKMPRAEAEKIAMQYLDLYGTHGEGRVQQLLVLPRQPAEQQGRVPALLRRERFFLRLLELVHILMRQPRLALQPLRMTYKPDERNVPGAIVEVVGPEGPLGTWLVSPQLNVAQGFDYQGRKWQLSFRSQRTYKPFSVTLLKFSHDKYPGTEIPRNFSSRVRVKSDDGRDDREVLIFMNNPLRYGGLTFYQAGFDNNDRTTILQVVRNPGWLLPYIACIMMGLGLCLQFGFSLRDFIRRRSSQPAGA